MEGYFLQGLAVQADLRWGSRPSAKRLRKCDHSRVREDELAAFGTLTVKVRKQLKSRALVIIKSLG
jgi:hypothetical protein